MSVVVRTAVSALTLCGIVSAVWTFGKRDIVETRGLFPGVSNVAARAEVTANATCGERGPEAFCRLSFRSSSCGVCDSRSPDPGKRHAAALALDGSARWWQSPTLASGPQYEWVTLTLDLKQEYQVEYVIVKAGPSPRPGSWVLERSLDGELWRPWQYFAVTEDECWSRFGVRPAPHNSNFQTDSEVICTSFFSRLRPLEGGEIHTSLVRGRPGLNSSSTELASFTRARYIRLRLQGMTAQSSNRFFKNADFPKKLFYTIRDITVGGKCVCNGHASECRHSSSTGETECECQHDTCGAHCDRCCPLYHQEPWRAGTLMDGAPCQKCQCFGHATSCHYDPAVAAARISLNIYGTFSGGGVCNNCSKHTAGVNCEQCEAGWYRPLGVRPDADQPCVPCNCHRTGSNGLCARDDSQGKPAGTCECKVGYAGERCDSCALGFHNFPTCEPCPCSPDGALATHDCGSNCECKSNVEGDHCERCKPGYFFLDRDNPDGCTECYCSGVTHSCVEASGYRLYEVNTLANWLISDANVSRTVLPSVDPDTGLLSVGNYELPGVDSYYWLAPAEYLGNKLTSYGATLTFRVSWVVMRGDTSGKPTMGPDIILVGENGVQLGYGESWYHQNNMSVTVQLVETGWYELGGGPVTRPLLLSVLANIKYLLLRAKFHTDQVEGSLAFASMETGVLGLGGTAVGYVEQCHCPVGYKGLSCELCDFGFARILSDGERHHAVCSKCNCHGHAETCNPVTGQCGECLHHTVGANCESCAAGYYGDATLESATACQPCACPLTVPGNNFSPSCHAEADDYVCTQCPQGYFGRHCQECAPGYYGDPLTPGSSCQHCNCGDGPCDQLTGQCVSCQGNTEGWRCEKCKPLHYGDPASYDCKPCECSDIGSVSADCHPQTGQCECKELFDGRSCNSCHPGLGNVTAGCVPCKCDSVGSTSALCDPLSGYCPCHPGVGGADCSFCLPRHYRFSVTGCSDCGCNQLGSLSQECDIDTGQCECLDNIVGRACDQCQVGWWGLQEGGCLPCNCDDIGSVNSSCDASNGQCYCKPGVGGLKCNQCLPLFYGLSVYGCAECDICNKPGHICDPDTGRCVCPPYTQGPECQYCLPNCWGHQAVRGCKPCNCEPHGSIGLQCNEVSGHCKCHEGYAGAQCNSCARGYYGFPQCRPCDCNRAGTNPQHCPGGVCVCDDNGQCPCKSNAAGRKCGECKAGTFGLMEEQPDGCVQCFCFNRTTQCREAESTWTQVRTPRPRALSIIYDNITGTENAFPVNTQEVCYINLAVPGSRGMSLNGDESRLNITNNLRIIPGDAWDVEIGVSYLFDSPVYWQLPSNFLDDKILSYGGYLRFTVETEGGNTRLPSAVLSSYPLIQMEGNHLILEHYPMQLSTSPTHSVRFYEHFWRMKNDPTSKVSREMLLVTLQNLQHILIRASDSVDFTRAILQDVTLDKAVLTPAGSLPRAHGIEQCECPPQYNATSCQDSARGFYRYHNKSWTNIMTNVIGESKPCQCNNRSDICDIETGRCMDCSDNTGGHHCGDCAEGFYGNPDLGGCKPCPCPSVEQNFAFRCDIRAGQEPFCACKEGYTGKLCDRCSYGWYGYPWRPGGSCVACECDPNGSVSDVCHEESGQCNCRPGISGRDCSQCQARHILTDRGCSSCDDGCTGLLLDKTELLAAELADKAGHLESGGLAPPWEQLFALEHRTMDHQLLLEQYKNASRAVQNLPAKIDEDISKKVKQLLNKAKKMEKLCNTTNFNAFDTKTEADSLFSEIKEMDAENKGIISQLQGYGVGDKEGISIAAALFEAKLLIGDIRDSNFEPLKKSAIGAQNYCEETLAHVQRNTGDFPDVDSLRERLTELQERVMDLDLLLSTIRNNANKASKITQDSRDVLNNTKKTIDMSVNMEMDVMKAANKSLELINTAKVSNDETRDDITGLEMMRDQLMNLTMDAEQKESELSLMNPIIENEYVRPAQRHAEDLMRRAQEYADLFVPTRQDAGFALRASKAYQDIVDALKSAREAADNASMAADIAYDKIYPEVGDFSMIDRASAVRAKSRELGGIIESKQRTVDDLRQKVVAPEASVEELRDLLTAAAHGDNAISRELQKLSTDFVGEAATESLMAAEELEDQTMLLKSDADSVTNKIENELKPAMRKLTSEGEESITAAQNMISQVNANARKAQDLASQIAMTARRQQEEFAVWNNSIAAKLNELRSKIMQARHTADGIRLSMTSKSDGGSCVRTYQPSHLEPSTMSSVVLTYAISSQQRDALLFYLPSSSSEDFLAVEMVNRKMRFVWNVGGGPGEVTHPLHIQTAGDLSNDQHWYRVEAERISNVGRLSVRPQVLPDGSPLASGTPVTNASAPGSGRLDVGMGDRVWVGGADKRPPQLLSTQPGLVGCLHRLVLDGRPIGLWNFRSESNNACTACIEGAEEVKDEQSYTFAGDGYVVLRHESSSAYNKYLFSVSLNFRTFDENALLFLAVSSQPDRFVSLTLSQGHVVFRIGYGGDSSLEISTVKTYNNGNWTRLEATRYFDRKKKVEKGLLKMETELIDGAPTPPPGQDAIPDFFGANFYVGGVPPGFKAPIPLPGSFLGCMSDVQVLQEGYNLLRNRFWGVQGSCSDKPLTVVGFHGDGYLELASHSLRKKSSFGFVFATVQEDALLMLSTFEGLDRLSYYTVSLRRGQLDVRLNAGRGEVRLASTGSEYADGRFHSLALSKTGRRLELRVDDSLHASASLPEGATVVKAPGAAGGLFFGGLPPGFNTTGRTVSSTPFTGTIKDAIFNDQLLHFDWPVSFEHASIGRLGPVKGSAVAAAPVMAARAVSSCRKVTSYTLQPGAVKFGDSAFTHVHVNFRKRSTFQRNFTLEIRFRTFYPEGLIFIVPGVRGKQHFIMVSLQNGRLHVVLKGRKKVEISAQAVLNDGTWHHMILQKENKKVFLKIDFIAPEKTKVPFKRMNVGSVMYVGGIPDAALALPMSLKSKIEGFKGCMEGLRLNGRGEDLVGDRAVPHRVGQCFPHIERGSYFPGDAYATYKTNFEVGGLLELELEFRTSEMSGILLSVAEPQGYPAISLELENGKVVLSGDMGDRRPFRLEQGFASEFAVCDNRWHHVAAFYADGKLTLKVDDMEQSYWLADHGHFTVAHTSSPLYIGGLPEQYFWFADHAPSGTLQSRENFKGCIRNVKISGEHRDWTTMAALHNILLSSCPLPS
ncbi:laminin subunit alpha-1 isoform X3 [Homalodisca vitripennis]|uniref:laminin subunit alpha-1 isoform X3 n=1 Tax=Homalodisca vitripennis TaxID=197043 RepID=UPI001EEC7801|nr:laminin subunit alpha-1 isoform X3 [Homalodisca vitripennis]